MATIVVKSIGTGGGSPGRDYSTIQAWEGAAPADLVAADQIWKGELYNDSEFVIDDDVLISGTVDTTRYYWLSVAAGHSFADHEYKEKNALDYDVTKGVGIRCTHAGYQMQAMIYSIGAYYTRFDRFQAWNNSTGTGGNYPVLAAGYSRSENLLIKRTNNNGSFQACVGRTSVRPVTTVNCVVISNNASAYHCDVSSQGNVEFHNCTFINSGGGVSTAIQASYMNGLILMKNTAVFGYSTVCGGTGWSSFNSGSNHNATDHASPGTNWGANSLTSLISKNEIEEIGVRFDARARVGSSLAGSGTRDQSYTLDLDIVGRQRSFVRPTIGAFERPVPDIFPRPLARTTGEPTDVSIDYHSQVADSITFAAGDTSRAISGLPTDRGLIVQLKISYSSVGSLNINSVRLSEDGVAPFFFAKGSNPTDSQVAIGYAAWPRITSPNQTITVTTSGDTQYGSIYAFAVIGADPTRMLGDRLMQGGVTVSTPFQLPTIRKRSGALLAMSSSLTELAGPENFRYHPFGGYNSGSTWVADRLTDAACIVPNVTAEYCGVEVPRGEKQRRSRFITAREPWMTQPQRYTPLDLVALARLDNRLCYAFTGDSHVQLAWRGGAFLTRMVPDGMTTINGVRTLAPSRYGPSSEPALPYPIVAPLLDISGASKITFYVHVSQFTMGDEASGVSVIDVSNGGGNYCTIGTWLETSPRHLGVSFNVADGYAASSCNYLLPIGFVGVVACTFNANTWALYANGEPVTPTSTTGTITALGGDCNRVGAAMLGLNPYVVRAPIAFASICAGIHPLCTIKSISVNPWQVFGHKSACAFTGTPVITHARRRIV